LETSFLDWRGKISAVIFLPGCNFHCPYCHNYALVSDPESLATIPLEAVLDRLRPFVDWIDGVVISGGEPTLHPRLAELMRAIKGQGFLVKLDTNGHRPEVIEDLAGRGLLDMVAMDLKAPLEPLAYARAAGRAVDLGRIRRSLDFLKHGGLPHEFRSTILPAWHGPAELSAMAQEVCGARAWTLQAMSLENAWNKEALGKAQTYSSDELARLQANLADPVCRAS
jgi:pyruvate formate lyase activating enzyme